MKLSRQKFRSPSAADGAMSLWAKMRYSDTAPAVLKKHLRAKALAGPCQKLP